MRRPVCSHLVTLSCRPSVVLCVGSVRSSQGQGQGHGVKVWVWINVRVWVRVSGSGSGLCWVSVVHEASSDATSRGHTSPQQPTAQRRPTACYVLRATCYVRPGVKRPWAVTRHGGESRRFLGHGGAADGARAHTRCESVGSFSCEKRCCSSTWQLLLPDDRCCVTVVVVAASPQRDRSLFGHWTLDPPKIEPPLLNQPQ